MSRLVIIFAIAAILSFSISIAQPAFPDSNYDPEEGMLKINLKKGWNLIPWVGAESPNTCGEDYGAKAIFIWSPTEKKYLGGKWDDVRSSDSEVSRIANRDKNAKYYYAQERLGALFILRDSDCSAAGRIGGTVKDVEEDTLSQVLPTYKIPAGWNFITIHPWMVNKNFGDFIGTCEITKAYTFDAVTGWKGGSVDKSVFENAYVTEDYVGVTYAMKFANDCSFDLEEEEVIGPPPLPE